LTQTETETTTTSTTTKSTRKRKGSEDEGHGKKHGKTILPVESEWQNVSAIVAPNVVVGDASGDGGQLLEQAGGLRDRREGADE